MIGSSCGPGLREDSSAWPGLRNLIPSCLCTSTVVKCSVCNSRYLPNTLIAISFLTWAFLKRVTFFRGEWIDLQRCPCLWCNSIYEGCCMVIPALSKHISLSSELTSPHHHCSYYEPPWLLIHWLLCIAPFFRNLILSWIFMHLYKGIWSSSWTRRIV